MEYKLSHHLLTEIVSSANIALRYGNVTVAMKWECDLVFCICMIMNVYSVEMLRQLE